MTLRVALWWAFGRNEDIGPAALGWMLPAGLLADAVECLYLFLPFSLYVCLMPDRWYRSRPNRWLILAASALTIFGLLYLLPTEFYFFEEFDARFNLVAVDYLMYPTEVFTDIWEAYPVMQIVAIAAILALILTVGVRRQLATGFDLPTRLRERLRPFGLHVLLLALAIALVPTNFLAHSRNRIANEIAQNGHSSFFRALRTSELDYDTYYRTRDPKQNFQRLVKQLGTGGGEFTRLADGRLDRRFAGNPQGLGRLNVVIVMNESFGAEFSKLYGDKRDLMPNFDRFAQQGIWFSNAYSSGTRTVRGLEAITSSFPPTPSESIVRRPGNDDVATLGKVLRGAGYQCVFLYGGNGYFDNMNAFFGANGYEILDRSSIKKVRFENMWGVSDEDLFDRALERFDELAAQGKPFLGQIMTTSNHKPFTFREGVPGVPAAGGGREAGVRYADFAVGYLLEQARKHPWFNDTVFVVVADHGARVYGKVEIPLKTYEIPLMFWSPAHLQPRRVDELTGQIDIAPTLLGLLGIPYTAPFFGQNVLAPATGPRIALFNHNHDIALYRDGRMVVLGLQKKSTTYGYDKASNSFTLLPRDAALEDLAIAYYQTAFEQFRAHTYR
ncbi:MAG: LTA synthase family protein [Steroidobacteraceae bacterium]